MYLTDCTIKIAAQLIKASDKFFADQEHATYSHAASQLQIASERMIEAAIDIMALEIGEEGADDVVHAVDSLRTDVSPMVVLAVAAELGFRDEEDDPS